MGIQEMPAMNKVAVVPNILRVPVMYQLDNLTKPFSCDGSRSERPQLFSVD